MLQEVGVLLQQPLNSDLGIVPSVGLHRQLLPEDADLHIIKDKGNLFNPFEKVINPPTHKPIPPLLNLTIKGTGDIETEIMKERMSLSF